jgi:hypothetical protein
LKYRPPALLFAVLALVAVAAGCGSDGDSGTGGDAGTAETSAGAAEAPLTSAEFAKAGNSICTQGIAEIEKSFEAFAKEKDLDQGKQPGKAELAAAVETILIPGINKQLEAIGALAAPQGEEQAVEEFLGRAEAELEKGEKNPTALTSATASKKRAKKRRRSV